MKIPDKVYEVLKWTCLICLPALANLATAAVGVDFEDLYDSTIAADADQKTDADSFSVSFPILI